jgi:hypothetical protein
MAETAGFVSEMLDRSLSACSWAVILPFRCMGEQRFMRSETKGRRDWAKEGSGNGGPGVCPLISCFYLELF